jgi:hypothetical protein
MKINPIYLYAPITRADEETREVEGYAFVNETVEGEGGIALLRSAMEAATEDYMSWGAIREMHQPSAAGTAVSVEWDEKGAVLRAKIVDDAAWEKVKAGVYKGFSVGVRPRIMRGKRVESAQWIETSLVDRPKDSDARFTCFRADDLCEIEVLEEVMVDTQSEVVADCSNCNDCSCEVAEDATCDRVDGEQVDYVARVGELATANDELIERLSNVEGLLARVQGLLEAANKRVQELESMPAAGLRPARNAAVERTFLVNASDDANPAASALLSELNRLERDLPSEADAAKRYEGVLRMQRIKHELALIGSN